MPQSLLNQSDTTRLTTCLDAIAAEGDAKRWEALDELRYFCDGADIPLLEVIGGKRFSTLTVLVQLLQLAEELGGPAALRDAPPAHRVPLGLVLRLLETLMCNATANLKPFLKTKDGVRLLIAVLARRDALVGMPDGEGLAILDHACNLLCYLTFHHPETAAAQFMAADGIAAASRVLECVRAHYARTLGRHLELNNAVVALTDEPTPRLLQDPTLRRVVAALIDEAVGVLRAAGIPTAPLRGLPVSVMPKILRLPTPLVRLVTRRQMKVDPEARSSMWEDLQRGRPTEIDYLNGEILRVAEAHGASAPVNARLVAAVRDAEAAGGGSPGTSPVALARALGV